jgi:hypothetical protein
MRDCLRLRTRKEVTRIITPTCNNDPAMKVRDASIGQRQPENSVLVVEEKQPELRLREQGLGGMPCRGLLPLQ